MATSLIIIIFRAFHCKFGRSERNTGFGGLFRQWSIFPLLWNVPCIFNVLLCFSRTCGSGVHLSCMPQTESEGKRWLPKQHILPSTCLLLAEHVISHHNSGLLLQIQQSGWPGPREHSDRYQTRDGWHTTRTLTVSPFSLFYMLAWIPYKIQSQWCMLQVAKHCTSGWDMHLFACLARWQSLNSLNKTLCDSAATTKPSLCFLLQSCFLYALLLRVGGNKINT